MVKHLYETPSTTVLKLEQETPVLEVSGNAGLQDYFVNDYYVE